MTNKIDVDWSVSPKGATMLIAADKEVRWASKEGQWVYTGSKNSEDGWEFITGNPAKLSCWKIIATRPTERKTVHDAVEAYPNGWPACNDTYLWSNEENGAWMWGVTKSMAQVYVVCTREEFEKAVAKKKKYTCYGGDVEVVSWDADEAGFVPVINSAGRYCVVEKDYIVEIPIKPTITKAEAWDKICEREHDFDAVNKIKSEYTITN